MFAITTQASFAGGDVRFLHGPRPSGHTLELEFININATKAELIREHYRTQQDGLLMFELSDEVWAGNTFVSSLGPLPVLWKYASQPLEAHKYANVYDVSVSLVSVI